MSYINYRRDGHRLESRQQKHIAYHIAMAVSRRIQAITSSAVLSFPQRHIDAFAVDPYVWLGDTISQTRR